MRDLSGGLRRNSAILLAFVVAAVLFIFGSIYAVDFASLAHIRTILITASFTGFVGVGQTLCMLTGGIDLSIPFVLAGAALVTANLANGVTSRLTWVIPLVLVAGMLVGLLNGLGVAYAGVPPIIMTLGMSGAIQGLLLIYTHGGFASSPPESIVNFVTGDTVGIPNIVLLWAAVSTVTIIGLSWAIFGRKLYAVGTNPVAAFLAGINVRRILVVPYAISGLTAALAGVLLLGFYGQAFTDMGNDFLFSSAIAVAVGGASILGGRGHYVGTIAGAIVLTLITADLDVLSMGTAAVDIAYGIILLAAVYFGGRKLGRRRVAG
jgi:ribose transport system permease protein